MTTPAAARRSLPALSTADLIGQYEDAISSLNGRYTDASPRQRRIDYIIDLLGQRADAGDEIADAFLRNP